jgi:hypothetical protein
MAAGGAPENSRVASLDAMPTPARSDADRPACDSCGAPADDTEPVRRVYVTPGGWDLTGTEPGSESGQEGDEPPPERVEVVDEVERWCFPCRSQYPHQPVAG